MRLYLSVHEFASDFSKGAQINIWILFFSFFYASWASSRTISTFSEMLILLTSRFHQDNFFEVAWVCLCSVFPYRSPWSSAPCISLFSAKVGENVFPSCTDFLVNEGISPWWGEVKWITQNVWLQQAQDENCALAGRQVMQLSKTLTNKPLSDLSILSRVFVYALILSQPNPTCSNLSNWPTALRFISN